MSNKRKRSAHIAAICIVYFIVMICDIQLTYAKGETKSSTEADIYSNIAVSYTHPEPTRH